MKLTLLDYTQNILSALSSDEVNSIGDTTESQQVAEIVKTCYFNILTRTGAPNDKKLFQLESSNSVSEPNLMFFPSDVKTVEWLKYYDSTEDMYKYVTILPLQQYVAWVNAFDITESWIDTLNFTLGVEQFKFNYRNDTQPTYCTVISNYYVIFDAYDSTVDSTLQESKTMGYGLSSPSWQMVDTFIPPVSDEQVPLLLNEAKSLAFLELKQLVHSKAEQESKRQWNTFQKNKSKDNKPSSFDELPDFGRKPHFTSRPYIKWS